MLTTAIARRPALQPHSSIQHVLNSRTTPSRLAQQARGFRFGMWTAHINPALHRELRRRERIVREKCMDTLAKGMSFDHARFHLDTRSALKRLFSRSWHEGGMRWSWHFVSQSDPAHRMYSSAQPWTENPYSGGPRGENTASQSNPSTSRDFSSSASSEPPSSDLEYIIDPITNKKVPKTTYGNFEPAVNNVSHSAPSSFGTEPSLFPSFSEAQPHHSNGPPPGEELNKYKNTTIDSAEPADFSEPAPSLFTFDSTKDQYSWKPTAAEEYSLNHLPAEEQDFPIREGELNEYKYSEDTAEVEAKEEAYEDLGEYKAYMHNESVDRNPVEPAYDDLSKYGMFSHKEGVVEAETASYEDLSDYKPIMHNENAEVEVAHPVYEDLKDYVPYKHQEELDREAKPVSYDDLNQYEAYMHKEAELGKEQVDKPYEDLNKYKPQVFDDFPDVTASMDQPFEQYGDLDKYIAYRDKALEGGPVLAKDEVKECLNEYDLKQKDNIVAAGDGIDLVHDMKDLDLGHNEEPVCVFDSTLHGVPAETPKGTTVSPEELEHPAQSHRALFDAADRNTRVPFHETTTQANKAETSPTYSSSMTGNYVRDFPEDFTHSWTVPTTPETTDPALEQAIEAEEKAFAEQLDAASTMPIHTASTQQQTQSRHRLESALNRRSRKMKTGKSSFRTKLSPERDSYSAKPQGLETSYAEECRDQPKGPAFVRTYGTQRRNDGFDSTRIAEPPAARSDHEAPYHRDPEIDGRGFMEAGAEPAAKTSAEAAVYRVLAYDSASQTVSIAETTSDVSEQSSSSTPADILLRLSSPSKFFPYFAPLQAEGFEIVSGGGDVLVFRKVRAPMHRVNPIDMMGTHMAMPSAAAFISPTGFVNYDIPKCEEDSAARDSEHGAGRRPAGGDTAEERTAQSGRPQPKRRLGKKIAIAGTSVVGLTYAAGVVAETMAKSRARSGRL